MSCIPPYPCVLYLWKWDVWMNTAERLRSGVIRSLKQVVLERPTGSMVENKMQSCFGDLPIPLDETPPQFCCLVQTAPITQSSLCRPLKGTELNSGEWMPFVHFEEILCFWKYNCEHLPTSLHCWQWQVVVMKKQGTRKQKLKNVSFFLHLISGNPSLLICLQIRLSHKPHSDFIQLHGNCFCCDSNLSRCSHHFSRDTK